MRPLVAGFCCAALAFGVQAQDAEKGKLLYETHCNECHYVRVHQRLRSSVKDLAELRDMVWLRSRETRARRFSVEELDDITAYLNSSYYRFGVRKP